MTNCACDVTLDQLDPSAPLSHFFLELTPACNNLCPACGSLYAHRASAPPLPAAGWRAVIDRLTPLSPRLRLSGGEPTMHPQFAEIVAYLNRRAIPFTVFTNARWADPAGVVRLLTSSPTLEGILVSLHGARLRSHEAFTSVRGSFAETLKNTWRAARAGVRVVTSTVITHQNYSEVAEIISLTRAMRLERATFSRLIGPSMPALDPSPEELLLAVQSIEQIRRGESAAGRHTIRHGGPIPHCFVPNSSNGCMAGFVHATIDPWGNLRPCPHVTLIAGNLLEQDFDVLWRSSMLESWREGLQAQCDGCPAVKNCRSSCQAQALWRGAQRDPLVCWDAQQRQTYRPAA